MILLLLLPFIFEILAVRSQMATYVIEVTDLKYKVKFYLYVYIVQLCSDIHGDSHVC